MSKEVKAKNDAEKKEKTAFGKKAAPEMPAGDVAVKHKKMSLSTRKKITGVCFALPCIIGLVVFFLFPMVQSLIISFSSVDTTAQGMVTQFVGIDYYKDALFEDAFFLQKLTVCLTDVIKNVPITVMFSFFAATLLNQKFKGNKVARVIFLLPIVMASATMMTLDSWDMFQSGMRSSSYREIEASASALQNFDLAGFLTQYSGLPVGMVTFLTGAVGAVYTLVRMSGVQTLILFTALQSVSPSLFEAANVEGATGWEKFWLITFPMISPMLLVSVIYTIIDTFTAFNNWVILYINDLMFVKFQYSLATAMSWMYFVIIVVILGLVAYIGSKKVFYYDK